MKKKLLYALFCVMSLCVLVSCKKDFLQVVPLGYQVAGTVSDYDKIMNDPALYYTDVAGWNEAALMGDEIAAEGSYFNNVSVFNTRLFQWQDSIYQPSDFTPYLLSYNLPEIYTLNLVIGEVMNASDGTDVQKKRIRAEALATRAWLNFQFINYYAKPYNAATAASDPGFPIIDKPDITVAKYDRGTVQGMYDFIIKDFQEALPDLPVRPSIVTRMSQPAVEGLLGKVYLFMGKYGDAATHFAAALSEVAANGAPVLYDYNQTFGPGGAWLPVDPTYGPSGPGSDRNDITEAVLSKIFYNGVFAGNLFGTDGVVLAPETAALFGPNDLRLKFYTNTNADGSPNAGGRLRKYNRFARFGLELPELLLLDAEVRARQNDLGGAVVDVETLRRNRMPVADAAVPADTAANQAALVKYIIDERIREFARDGYRWFDMRRLSVDPLFAGITFTHTIYNADGTTTEYVLNQPKRLVLQIPPRIAITNPGFENNP